MKTIDLHNSVVLGTSEAFFGKVFHDGKVIMVPYANVGLLNYDYDGRLDHWINKCLFVSRDTTQFRCDDEITTIGGATADGFIVLGGVPIEASPPWYEADFYSTDAHLILFNDSRFSDTPFAFKADQLEEFFNRRNWGDAEVTSQLGQIGGTERDLAE